MMQDENSRVNRTSGMPRWLTGLGEIFGRSFFPLIGLVIILGTPWWGGWGTLVLALVAWSAVMRYV